MKHWLEFETSRNPEVYPWRVFLAVEAPMTACQIDNTRGSGAYDALQIIFNDFSTSDDSIS